MTTFTQLDEGMRVASMRPVATLALEPIDFAERWNVILSPGPGNLGDSVGALLQTEPEQHQFALLRRLEGPASDRGVELLAPERDDPDQVVRRFLDAFGLDDSTVQWSLGTSRGLRAG